MRPRAVRRLENKVQMENQNRTRRRPSGAGAIEAVRGGFTLVELLVVIAIIAMLIAILVPSIAGVIRTSAIVRARTRIKNLDDGCRLFWQENDHYYPAQPPTRIESGGDYEGKGSLFLAWALSGEGREYANFKDDDILKDDNGNDIGISDQFGRNPMAILYYPSRVGIAGLDQYSYNDNDNISTAWSAGAFTTYITDDRFSGTNSTTPYMSEQFLLIGASTKDLNNRTYGSEDNLTNFHK